MALCHSTRTSYIPDLAVSRPSSTAPHRPTPPHRCPPHVLQTSGTRSPFRLLHETLADSEFLNDRPSGDWAGATRMGAPGGEGAGASS